MALGNKKKSELKYHTDVEEFIPYAAHFDEETLVTKNGELMQVIKITGFQSEVLKDNKEEYKPLRALIREALQKNIRTDDYSIWIHTIRREADISTGGVYNGLLAKQVNQKWNLENKLHSQFINELYITIVKEGEIFPIKDPSVLINNLFPSTELKARNQALINAQKSLNQVTGSIIEDLGQFGARRLSIYKKDGIYYSELVSLASKIMNLKSEELPLLPCNLSEMLPTKTVNFQYNTVQVEGETKKHFGAIYSIKEYREVTLDELDKLIQLPVNLIITQCFCFVGKKEALAAFEDQKKIYELSYSKYMSEISGIKELFEEDTNEATGFGEQQITVTVLEDTVKALQNSISMVVDNLRDMGLYAVREDLFMENCYWSMMPANFDFICRKTYLPFKKISGFGSLYNFTTGKYDNNKWGNAVTTFFTSGGMPYFFNFHYNDNGNTLIVGDGEKRDALLRFLLLEAEKFNPNIFILEAEKNSEVFVKAIGGSYYKSAEIGHGHNFDSQLKLGVAVGKDPVQIIKLINEIEQKLNTQERNIIVLDHSITNIQSQELVDRLYQLSTEVSQKNGIIILTANTELKHESRGVFNEQLISKIETLILLYEETADFRYKDVFCIKEKELKALKAIDPETGEIIVKRHGDSVVVKFNSKEINKRIAALSDSDQNIKELTDAQTLSGSESPDLWLPHYYSKKGL